MYLGLGRGLIMPRWTAAARARQRRLINQVKPWEKSTGPKTPHGKSQSARNGCNHPPRAPGTHPDELRRSRRRLWKLWRLQLDLVPLGLFDPAWATSIADQLVAVEAGLGIPRDVTAARLTGSLARLAKRRASAAAKTVDSERVPDSVA